MELSLTINTNMGDKIRAVRKSKKMTLEDLAEGICSLGKMSNIENNRQLLKEEELKLICEKLDIPQSYLVDPRLGEKVTELDFIKQQILDFIELEEWSMVKAHIDIFKEKIDLYQIPSRLIDLSYLYGLYYHRIKEYKKAEASFSKVIDTEENDPYFDRLKINSYSALASIMFNKRKITRCLQLLEKGLDISKSHPAITKVERNHVYFNFCLVSLYSGNYHKSMFYINKLSGGEEIEYLLFLTKLIEDESFDEIKGDLLRIRQQWNKTSDVKMIIRGWALTITMIVKSYGVKSQFANNFKKDFLNFVQKDTSIFHQQKLSVIQLALYTELEFGDNKEFMSQLLILSEDILSKIHTQINSCLLSRHHLLKGRYLLLHEENETESEQSFHRALSILANDQDNLLKGEILYHICNLKKNYTPEMMALHIYYEHSKNNSLFSHFQDVLLPSFKF